MSSRETFDLGLANRSAVLGKEHVERSLAAATEFGRPLQELVTEYCWGAVWGRPVLDFKTRSLLNIVMLTALNRQHELSVHVRGAITNGCTVEEIREALIHTAAYCGVPAAIEATRTAEAVLDSLGVTATPTPDAQSHDE